MAGGMLEVDVSDEPEQTYSARDIVLEFFPATHERLIPVPHNYRLERNGDGWVLVRDAYGRIRMRLTPIETHGSPSTQLCCDLCNGLGNRRVLQVLRAEIPGSQGRRFRYVTACRDTEACETRRLDDGAVEALLRSDS